MAAVNKVILVGHLGKDPKISTLNNGDKAASFTLATSESWKDKNTGERREKTEWHNVVVYNENIVRVVSEYCRKGSKIYLEGQLGTRKYTDQSGQDKYRTEIIIKQFRGEVQLLNRAERGAPEQDSYGTTRTRPAGGSGSGSGAASGGAPSGGGPAYDDEIPF